MIDDLNTFFEPTTVQDTDGGWFAGIKYGVFAVYYWRNNKFTSECDAATFAKARIAYVVEFINDDFGPMQQLGMETENA